VPELDLPAEIILTFEEARVVYLALSEAYDRAPQGSELRLRLDASKSIVSRKLLGDLGGLT
jgi:hypothetical protein